MLIVRSLGRSNSQFFILRSKSSRSLILFKEIAYLSRVKHTREGAIYKRTAFFQHLLHQQVPRIVRCASLLLNTSRKIASLMRHRERTIIAVRSCLPWIIYMYTYMDRKHVRIWSNPWSFWTTICVTRKLIVTGAANTEPKKSLSA